MLFKIIALWRYLTPEGLDLKALNVSLASDSKTSFIMEHIWYLKLNRPKEKRHYVHSGAPLLKRKQHVGRHYS